MQRKRQSTTAIRLKIAAALYNVLGQSKEADTAINAWKDKLLATYQRTTVNNCK